MSIRTVLWNTGEEGVLIEEGAPSKLHRSHDVLQVRHIWEETFQLLDRLEDGPMKKTDYGKGQGGVFGYRGRE